MIRLRVNGIERSFDGDPEMPVLWYLRDILGLTGTKFACGVALCGACTVHQNGRAIRSCVVPVRAAAGAEITTIEGISAKGLHPVQQAWMAHNVPQCGYCSIARGCEITATNGAIDQSNFYDYPVARIAEAPYQTNVHVVESAAPPAGVGEPGVSVIAPALCNAMFAATGKRVRDLPLSKSRLS